MFKYTSEIDLRSIDSIKIIEFKEIDEYGDSLPEGILREEVDNNDGSPTNKILAMKPIAWGQQGSKSFVVILKKEDA